MGRLQKKKTVAQKLKHKEKLKTKEDVSAESANSSAISKKPVFGSVSSKDSKIKLVQPSKKNTAGAGTMIDKMGSGDGKIAQGIQFLREVKIELKKVTWPTRQQTIASTVVVIILVIIISLFLGLVDMGLSKIIEVLLH